MTHAMTRAFEVLADVPDSHLISHHRFICDLFPSALALGRHGYAISTLQAAMRYLLSTSLGDENRKEKAKQVSANFLGSGLRIGAVVNVTHVPC